MLRDANFLCEIGTEEIPAGYFLQAIEKIENTLISQLKENRIEFEDIEVLATPRRIILYISNLADSQKEEEIEVKGPSIKAAYDKDNNPTRALEGFLKGNQIDKKDISVKKTDKGEYIFAKKILGSEKTITILPEMILYLINNLIFPKSMRWGDKKISFPRPIRYFLILLNNEVVPFELEGIKSSNLTKGHYIRHNRMIEINEINKFEEILKENDVIINHDIRKDIIKEELIKAANEIGGILNEDEDLIDTVTFLVESPYIVTCKFEKRFLEIPDIALIAEMREHQKYFSIYDKDNNLMNFFLVVSNNPDTEFIVSGNERVITARFSDAQFFYNEDKKKKLSDKVESLKDILFHKELGSIYDKIERMKVIAEKISAILRLDKNSIDKILRAVYLSKSDLNSAMVIEFPSLQGRIGKIYALNDGEDAEVANAIDEQYHPRSGENNIPKNIISVVVSLSEKIDNIFGSFSVGNIPKGSQDPYALRRQANAIIEIILSNDINMELNELLYNVSGSYKDGKDLVIKIVKFIEGRVKTIFSDKGLSYDEIDACLSIGCTNYNELLKRAKSINEFREDEKFSDMLMSFKRMNNILSGFIKKNKDYSFNFNESLLIEKEEKDLYAFFNEKKSLIDNYIESNNYSKLFQLLIDSKKNIDRFFDKVLVMDKDIKIRDNRLSLINNILDNFTDLLDFSKISE